MLAKCVGPLFACAGDLALTLFTVFIPECGSASSKNNPGMTYSALVRVLCLQ
jgi:hypothetical protein